MPCRLPIPFAIALTVLAVAVSPAAPERGVEPRIQFGARHSTTEAEARSTATDFFRSINERRYERTCALLSRAYYRQHRIRSRRHCVIGLRIGFMWSQEIRFRFVAVDVKGPRVIVRALANEVPGRIVLVRERGILKVLALEGV